MPGDPSWEDLLGARPWGHLYRSTYRSKNVRCPSAIQREDDGSWRCVLEVREPGGKSRLCDARGSGEDATHLQLMWVRRWSLKYDHNGRTFYESTRTGDWNKALAFKKRRFREIHGGDDPWAKRRNVTLSEILALVLAHYRKNKLKSLARQEQVQVNLLRFPKFLKGAVAAVSLTETVINDEYVEWRQAEQGRGGNTISNGTINRELSMLRQGFKMAYCRRDEHGHRLVQAPPVIKMLKEAPPREGYFEAHSIDVLLAAVRQLDEKASPEDLADLIEFYWLIGWRNAAARGVERTDIDWFSEEIVLRRVLSKSGEPVRVPFGSDKDLRALLLRRERLAVQLEAEMGKRMPWLFFRRTPAFRRGHPIRAFYTAWRKALKAAGLIVPGRPVLTPHAFRRSAARDTLNASGDPLIACDLVGWNSLQMLKRYRITSKSDLERVIKLRSEYRQEQRSAAQLALPFAKKKG